MNAQNPALETIFNAAKALPPESRAEYLSLACREDASLRREIERLLDLALDEGLAPDVEQRLRNFGGQRQEPLALAGGKNDHAHET